MVRLEGVSVALGGRRVVEGVSAAIRAGELVGLIGPNGAGKSTLARAIAGLIPIETGSIALAGPLAYLPQERALHWPLTVERVVALGRLPSLGLTGRPGPADHAAVARAIARLELEPFAQRRCDMLSGGELARALLARALTVEAPLLIADEPLAALDPAHAIQAMEVLAEEARSGAAVIVVLHDLAMAARWCDRLLLLDRGRLVADGAPGEVLTAERLAQVYGVRAMIGEAEGRPLILPLGAASPPWPPA